eukprot:TRINITY_DN67282_c6_g2_i1.p1 TRINITY_DN67282_c6_g2~~TRINITY_DN67282_c6_g2_i1.p1  ORF type:complete len:387 (+),score=13.28 TRINITY_DN67282_c6_g2_i1:65-1225(+)
MADVSHSKRPADTPFKQQRLPAWQPILSPPWIITCFFLIAGVFIPIGVLIIVASNQVVEVEARYDNLPAATFIPNDLTQYKSDDPKIHKTYLTYKWVQMRLPKTMEPPVYMYYKLTNFYQNHRRYGKSKDSAQLSGADVGIGDVPDCKPYRWAGEVDDEEGMKTDENMYEPCGLIPYSMFNDTFDVFLQQTNDPTPCDRTNVINEFCLPVCRTRLSDEEEEKITMNKCTGKGIAWASDRNKRFREPFRKDGELFSRHRIWNSTGDRKYYYKEGPVPGLREGHQIPKQTDEDFMVWMRTSSLPTFRKLYRIFPNDSLKGNINVWVLVHDRYDVSLFGGEKYIIFGTTSWIGSKNYFVGGAYIAVGCLCFVLALVFVIKHLTGHSKTS